MLPSSLPQSGIESLADSLWNARISGVPRAPLTEAYPELTVSEAYGISRSVYQRRIRDPNVVSVGRKVGLTSFAVQKQLGVDQPDFGFLTSDMQIEDRGILPAGRLIQGRVEGEVAFVLKKDLVGTDIKPLDVAAATDYVVPCIEVVDSRIADWKIRVADTVADNASAGYFVLGRERRKLDRVQLRTAGMALWLNGEVESTGAGAACMNDPINAVAWLANTLSALGDGLKAGSIILSGAYGPVVPVKEGDECEVQINGLGSVSFRYERKES